MLKTLSRIYSKSVNHHTFKKQINPISELIEARVTPNLSFRTTHSTVRLCSHNFSVRINFISCI